MVLGGAIFSIGADLLHTFKIDTALATWIGYQILIDAGNGMITQQPRIAIKAVLPKEDIPIDTTMMVFLPKFRRGALSLDWTMHL